MDDFYLDPYPRDPHVVAIIPARMGSSRFPGKPLARILGHAMIYHVYKRCKMSEFLSDVYIATCDEEIETYCLQNNMNVIMTKDTHERCSDRTAEAMLKIENKTAKRIDIVVMVQGDEPLVYPEMIDNAVNALIEDDSVGVVNLMAAIHTHEEHEDPNQVKVVVDQSNYALYFSREAIPSRKKGAQNISMYKQVCIIPFHRDFLIAFNEFEQTPLEMMESIDMLRVLENGFNVLMVPTLYETYSVDTEADLQKVIAFMESDPLVRQYIRS
jgi:3-deoxy-manno-octulosonate cytidylyltransferase (CMP-KDO synthetase)